MEDEGRSSGSLDFAALLREYRLAAGLSQEALAERARMSSNGISALERGYRRTPQRETLALLVDALALDDEQRRTFETAATRRVAPRRLETASATLPIALTSFVGREIELGEIGELVRGHRLVTLTGSGGIGKTQTALQVATALSDAGQLPICFVDLAPISSAALLPTAIAAALDVLEVHHRTLLETVEAYLADKSLLLILDNCEHVILEAARTAETLLIGCPNLRILATSREPLRSGGEYVYRLPSLSSASSIALFADRAQAADQHFTLTDESAPAVAALCRKLEGIPLAIELAAARVGTLSVNALTEMLTDRFRLLSGGYRNVLPRRQALRATIDWSYELLDDSEKLMFERLSVFPGGCTLGAAEAIWLDDGISNGNVLALLSALLDKSLVTVDFDGSEPRYRFLESFRQYAAEKLALHGEEQSAARRHALALLAAAERLGRAYDSEPDAVWRALAREDLDNWRAALQWTLSKRNDVLVGQRLVGELQVVWQYFAPLEGRRWLQAALDAPGEGTPAAVRARLEYTGAIIAWVLRDHNEHLKSSQRAMEFYNEAGDALGIARAKHLTGHALATLGRFSEAIPEINEALKLARPVGAPRLIAYTLRMLAWATASSGGDISKSRECIAEALQIYEELGSRLSVALALYDLGECEFSAGNPDLALLHATEAVATLRTLPNLPEIVLLVAMALDNVAVYLVWLGRYDEGERCAREVLDLAREHQLDVLFTYALQHLGAIATLRDGSASPKTARIFGFVDARLAALGSTRMHNQEQSEYDRALAVLRDSLGSERVAELMKSGAAMTQPDVVKEALEG